jgi:signal transduction histidine kinase
MSLFSGLRGNIRFWLKGYMFIGVAILILGVLIYSNHLISRMHEQTEVTTRLFARFIDNVHFQIDEEGHASLLLEVMKDTKLPIIITVKGGYPVGWHNVGVEAITDDDLELFEDMDIGNPPPGKISKVMELVREFDRVNRPIPVDVVGAEAYRGLVHYGNSPLERELRYMPFIQLALFLLFMGVAIQGLRYLKVGEQRSIWVGMAKETAHQLGTPLSALLGWTQILKNKVESGRYEEIRPSIQEMEVDLTRLSKITERFSKIGSQPELNKLEVGPILDRTVSYFHRRLPKLKSNSTIELQPAECPTIMGNEELLEWVFENLIKNGLDALGDGGGKIDIWTACHKSGKHIDVYVKDTGKGIPAGHREQIFRPGFTTKKRGWGLGLALTQRIVEDYHSGSLKLIDSRPGKGTTFSVRLPAA